MYADMEEKGNVKGEKGKKEELGVLIGFGNMKSQFLSAILVFVFFLMGGKHIEAELNF